MPTAEVAQMEAAAEYGFAQQLATEAATMPGELLLPLLPGLNYSRALRRPPGQCGPSPRGVGNETAFQKKKTPAG